jgi:uncharacterized membrane protein
MKIINKFLYIIFIIACIVSILFIYNLSCAPKTLKIEYSVFVLTITAFITIIIGIFTNPTHTIQKRLNKSEKINNLLKKLRNPILISSVLSTVFLILSVSNIIQISDNTINIIINSIMSILSILGVLNAPYKKTDSKENQLNK